MSSPERRVVLKEDEYLVPLVPISAPLFPLMRSPTRFPVTTVSKYVINIEDLSLEKVLILIRKIKEFFQDLIYNVELHEKELIIYLKTRKMEKIESKLNELKESLK